ncbi:MAG TPA: hypothetical protein DCF62_12765 [Porticoccaceae bacterium]|nr:hypothetical protein [Porticoccaceae bacterium]HCO61512.1 hypothetical protein [Porticoccaceae bacterium]
MTQPDNQARRYNLVWLALAVFVVPLVVVHVAYLASVIGGYVPLCNPYVDGCASISASGRHGFSYVFFKLGMIPVAVLLALFWIACRQWLLLLGDENRFLLAAIVIIGVISAVFLVLYTIYLGSRGDFYRFMRRTGVMVYFAFSYLAQMLLLARIQRLRMAGRLVLPAYIPQGKMALVCGLFVIGLASIPVSNFMVDKDRLENVIEWTFSLMMVSYYFFTWRAWRHSGLFVHFRPLGFRLRP